MAKVAFLFAGQGAQAVGMGKGLVERLPAARDLFARAQEIVGFDLLDVCLNGPVERLNLTEISQPAIYVVSLAALESLRQSEPEAVEACAGTAGLSLGEYTALAFAGVVSFEEGLQLVYKRGQAMQAASNVVPSGMASVLLIDLPKVEAICQEASVAGQVSVANLLCPGNTVISGESAAIDRAEQLATAQGAKVIRLPVAGAFHTSIMEPADLLLEAALQEVTLQTARIPVWANADAQPHTAPDELKPLMVDQVVKPVRWEESMRGMLAAGFDKFYEIGPGRVLAGLLKRIDRKLDVKNVNAVE